MAAAARPRFLLSSSASAGFVFPMAAVAGLSLADCTPTRERGSLQPQPLLHQQKVYVDDRTPAAATRLELKLLLASERQGDAHKSVQQLWDTLGTSKLHLWLVDDDQYDTLTTSNAEVAGASQVVEYAAPAKTWFATNDYLFVPSGGGGSGDEIVVAAAKTDATPSFTATLAYPHAGGAVCYRVAMAYPNALLQGIRSSAVPLGKGSFVLSFLVQDVPLYGTTLPS